MFWTCVLYAAEVTNKTIQNPINVTKNSAKNAHFILLIILFRMSKGGRLCETAIVLDSSCLPC